MTEFAFIPAAQMGHFSGLLDSVKNVAGPSRGTLLHAASKPKSTTTGSPPPATITDLTPRASEEPACPLQGSLCTSPQPFPPCQQDKGKQPAVDQQKKHKRGNKGGEASTEVREGSVMEDARKEVHCEKYVSFNLMTDTRGRVVNIEEAFGNPPYYICLSMQWMNESLTIENYGLLTKRVGIELLNHTMLLTYKVSFLPHPFYLIFGFIYE